MDYGVEHLTGRLAERGLPVDVAPTWDIGRRLHPGWERWFLDLVDEGGSRQNQDFAPLAVFLSLSYWNTQHAPGLGPFFRLLRNARPWMPAAVLLLIAVPFAISSFVGSRRGNPVVTPSVFGTGFAGMVLSLSLVFAFQSLFGHLFFWIGVLTAVFMAGSAVGALLMTRRLGRMRNMRAAMVLSEVAVLLLAALISVAVPRIGPILEDTGAVALLRSLFLFLPFSSGLLTGAQFPLAARLREQATGRRTTTAGTLYAADLLGGWLGGILGGVFLLPVLGLAGAGLTVSFLKLLTLLLFLLSLLKRAAH